ncbi:MAG TPA: hypothetical protein VKY74_25880 [Chloroflexia bacterium]|nr:hypothetical protein [Chloroflexia bacterium]
MDLRYLVQLDGQWVYSVCVIDGYSRQILAGLASYYQDTIAVLQLLYAALNAYGCPGGLIEAQFKVQLRRADAHFEQSTTLEQVQAAHARFVATFNTTPHWAPTVLAHYEAHLDRARQRVQKVAHPTLYRTGFASPQ